MYRLLIISVLLLTAPQTFGALGTDKTFKASVNGETYKYRLYLPPNHSTAKKYPVLFYLPGCGGNGDQVEEILPFFDKGIREGKSPELIVAALYTGKCALIRDPLESVIIKDWIPLIENTYGGIGTREGRWLHGQSFGGRGAHFMASKHSELFSAVSSTGAALTKGKSNEQEFSPWVSLKKHADKMRGRVKLRMFIGSNDEHKELINFNKEYSALLKQLNIEHEFSLIQGASHGPRDQFSKYKGDVLEFYRKAYEQVKSPGQSETVNIDLKKGWNLVGIPLSLQNDSIESLISPHRDKLTIIFGYDSATRSHLSYDPALQANELTRFKPGDGYWIYMADAAQLTLKGKLETLKYSFEADWNLVGFYGTRPQSIAQFFGSSSGSLAEIQEYDTELDSYKVYIPGERDEIRELKPGLAYWVRFTEKTTLIK